MTRDDREERDDPALVHMARYSGHGLTFALSMVLFLLAGWWADGRLGTSPLLTLIGAFVGAGAGFYSMLQHLILIPRERERAEREAREAEQAPKPSSGDGEGSGGRGGGRP